MKALIESEKTSDFKTALKAAFPHTIPVLAGYLFIGAAFGVMFAEQGYSPWWALLMSVVVYAGSGQYLATTFFVPGFSFVQAIGLTILVNIRHVFYGLSLVEKYNQYDWKRWYCIFGLTDETYSLICTTEPPEGVREDYFSFSITLLDHIYWIIGGVLGSILITATGFNGEGIEFAMTALFLVLFIELWMKRDNRPMEVLGILCSVVALLLFGQTYFILPAMLLIIAVILVNKKRIEDRDNQMKGAGKDA